MRGKLGRRPRPSCVAASHQTPRLTPSTSQRLHAGGNRDYTIYRAEIGGGLALPGHIALTVFARTSDVASGALSLLSRKGVNRGMKVTGVRMANKGAVGLGFRCVLSRCPMRGRGEGGEGGPVVRCPDRPVVESPTSGTWSWYQSRNSGLRSGALF